MKALIIVALTIASTAAHAATPSRVDNGVRVHVGTADPIADEHPIWTTVRIDPGYRGTDLYRPNPVDHVPLAARSNFGDDLATYRRDRLDYGYGWRW